MIGRIAKQNYLSQGIRIVSLIKVYVNYELLSKLKSSVCKLHAGVSYDLVNKVN